MGRDTLVEKIKKDIICGDDGFYVYWPEGSNGAYNEHLLGIIIDILEQMNKDWAEKINSEFSENSS